MQSGITAQTVRYICPQLYIPPPPALAQAPPPPPAPGAPQLPASPDSSCYMPLNDVSWGSGDIHMLMDLPDTPELIKISSDNEELVDQLEDDLEEDPKEDPEMEQPHLEHGIDDVDSTVFGNDMGSSSNLDEKPDDSTFWVRCDLVYI